ELMAAGLADGLDAGHQEVERAGRRLVDALAAVMRDAQADFRIDPSDSWWGDFSARVNAELAQHDVSPRAAKSRGQVVITQNFNVPSAERASDKALHGMRRLEAFGLFDG